MNKIKEIITKNTNPLSSEFAFGEVGNSVLMNVPIVDLLIFLQIETLVSNNTDTIATNSIVNIAVGSELGTKMKESKRKSILIMMDLLFMIIKEESIESSKTMNVIMEENNIHWKKDKQ